MSKVPDDAFDVYVNMGQGRSYQALAQKYGVDKRTIVRIARREDWKRRLMKIQNDVRRETDRKLVRDLHAVRERHVQQSRFVQGLLLKAMKEAPPREAARMVGPLSLAWRHEMFILGNPEERQATTIEEVTRQEIQTLLVVVGSDEDDESGDEVEELGPVDEGREGDGESPGP